MWLDILRFKSDTVIRYHLRLWLSHRSPSYRRDPDEMYLLARKLPRMLRSTIDKHNTDYLKCSYY